MFSMPSFSEEDVFSVDPGMQIIEMSFYGEQKELLDTMRVLLQSIKLECNSSVWKINEVLGEAIQNAQTALRAYGYYHAKIERDVVREQDCWSISLTLYEGPQTVIEDIDLQVLGEAASDEQFLKLIQANQPQVGDTLSHDRYEQLKKKVLAVASKRGYFDGQFVIKQLKVDQLNNSAAFILHYQSGVRYRIGEIMIEQDALNEALFYKYISIESGDLFNDSNLVSTYQSLAAGGYYSSIDVSPVLGQRQHGEVPVRIKAVKGKSKSYSVGLGASTDTGPRIKVSHSNQLSNNRGHSHRTQLSLSPVISNLGFSYRIPAKNPKTDYFEFNTHARHEDTETSTSDTFDLGVARTKLIESDWLRVLSLQYSLDDFDVGGDDDTTKLLRPSLGFSKLATDFPLRPTRGYRLNYGITGASESVLSDIDFAQAQINAKYVRGFSEKFRFLSRIDLGHTIIDEFNRLPSNLRFFAGGDSSIRGYGYESLGPKNSTGEVVGGESLIVGSVEVDYMFKPKWSAAVFVDSGNAFDEDLVDAKTSAGFGVRWQSPIGPIRFDIGFPVDDPEEDKSLRLHFTLGPDL